MYCPSLRSGQYWHPSSALNILPFRSCNNKILVIVFCYYYYLLRAVLNDFITNFWQNSTSPCIWYYWYQSMAMGTSIWNQLFPLMHGNFWCGQMYIFFLYVYCSKCIKSKRIKIIMIIIITTLSFYHPFLFYCRGHTYVILSLPAWLQTAIISISPSVSWF